MNIDFLTKKKQEIVDESFVFYENLPIIKIINSYLIFENKLIEKLYETIKIYFQFKGYKCINSVIEKSENSYSLSLEFLKIKRTLFIKMTDIIEDVKNLEHTELEITQQIGLIKCILIIYPESLSLNIKEALELLKTQIIAEYESIELAYLRNADELNQKFFRRLYDKFNHFLLINNNKFLCDKYWFVIGHKDSFHYFFDSDKSKILIEILKNNQLEQYSPFELLIALIKTPLDFQESLAGESWRRKDPVTKKWVQLDYKDAKLLYFLCEKVLYPSDGHTVWSISESRNYVLGIAISNHVKNQIIKELNKTLEQIEQIFCEGVSEYSIFFKTMNSIKTRISSSEFPILLSRMAGAFVSEFN